jgi:hypothetical protein
MKQILLIVFFGITIGFAAFGFEIGQANGQVPQAQVNKIKNSTKKTFVLLELFTSEGCPTCPPADANLARIESEQPIAGTEIVTLALHVDYWNSVTWKDKYSSPIFSRRQQLYTHALKTYSNFTPQMFVDGRAQLIGSDMSKARKALTEATKTQKAIVEIVPAADKFKVEITNVPAHENATVFLAVAEDNLASGVRGSGNSVIKPAHVSVVRELKSVGMLTAGQSSLEIEFVLPIQSDWKKENLKLIVFVQENLSRRVLGVSRIKI